MSDTDRSTLPDLKKASRADLNGWLAFAWAEKMEECARLKREADEVRILRGALRIIADDAAEDAKVFGSHSDLRWSDVVDFAEAALCPHIWKSVTVSSPQEPQDTDVVCDTCGVNQHEFFRLIGIEARVGCGARTRT